MKTKALLSVILILLGSISLLAQSKKCKFDIDKVDPIDGKRNILTEYKQYTKAGSGFKIKLVDTLFSIFVSRIFPTDNPGSFEIEKGAEIILLLSNKDTIISHALATKIGPRPTQETDFLGNVSYITSIENYYLLTKDQINRLKNSPLILVRQTATLPNLEVRALDLEVIPKYGNVVIDLISCIESKLQ